MGSRTTTHQSGSAAPRRTTPQKIIICIDGTGQDERKPSATNVRKFRDSLKKNEANQKVLYLSGVGSRSDRKKSGKLFGISGGSGAKRIRMEGHANLALNFMPGDKIYFIGFSRGAAICRTLANAINKDGIPQTIRITRDEDGDFNSFKSSGTSHRPPIEMLGVFDTVASFGVGANLFGIPFQKINLFKNLTIAGNIKQAYHLVSVDENRDAFEPTLMNADDHISEVWFAGVHTDVGGGYKERELSDVTLRYMINRAKKHGLEFDNQKLKALKPNPLGVLHDRDRFANYKLSPRKIRVKVTRSKKDTTDLRPKLHKSVSLRTKAREALVYQGKKKPAGKAKYQPKSVLKLAGDYRIDRKD